MLIYQTDEQSLMYLSYARSAMRACQVLLFGYALRIGTMNTYKLQENWDILRNSTGMATLLNVGSMWYLGKLRKDFVFKIEFDTMEQVFIVTQPSMFGTAKQIRVQL